MTEKAVPEPRIETFPGKKLTGKKLNMSFAENRTFELWRSFMPWRKEIPNAIGTELYSVQIYPPGFFEDIDPNAEFEKWAAVEVPDFTSIPDEKETMIIPSGLYAVFHYKGAASAAAETFEYIFGTWLRASGFGLDDRPHFEILGEKYKNEDPDSEEDIWIPVK